MWNPTRTLKPLVEPRFGTWGGIPCYCRKHFNFDHRSFFCRRQTSNLIVSNIGLNLNRKWGTVPRRWSICVQVRFPMRNNCMNKAFIKIVTMKKLEFRLSFVTILCNQWNLANLSMEFEYELYFTQAWITTFRRFGRGNLSEECDTRTFDSFVAHIRALRKQTPKVHSYLYVTSWTPTNLKV